MGEFNKNELIKSIEHLKDNCVAHPECEGCKIVAECGEFRTKLPDEWLKRPVNEN